MRIIGPHPSIITHQNILDFFQLRHETFVISLGWNIPSQSKCETDQYDFPYARFILAYSKNRCIGGLRLAPTQISNTDKCSFMLQDFITGKIETAFKSEHVTQPIKASLNTWEMTRFVSDSRKTTKLLLEQANQFLRQNNIDKVLTLSPVPFVRILKANGYKAIPISKEVTFEDGRSYVAISTEVKERKIPCRSYQASF